MPKLVQNEYMKTIYDNAARVIHWELCEKWGFERADKWYEQTLGKSLDHKSVKVFGTFPYRQTRSWRAIGQILQL